MLKAEQFIQLNALSQWTQSWDESTYINYYTSQIHEHGKLFKVRSSMEENIVKVKKLCADMGETTDFNTFMKLMNRIIFNCYFKQGNSALRIANFHEEVLVPADHPTRDRMFGFQQGRRETGELQVYFEKKLIGQLSEQSDMFHLIYDASFLTEDELFDEPQLLLDDTPVSSGSQLLSLGEDVLLTLKVWESDVLNMSLKHFTDLFLFHCSTQLGLNFKRASFEHTLDKSQAPINEKIQVQAIRTEKLPLLYFNSASHHLPPAVVFMSYYHAIDHFFERAKNLVIREKMQALFESNDPGQSTHLRNMARAVNSLKDNFSEKEALSLVMKRVVEAGYIISWLEENPEVKIWATLKQSDYPDLPLLKMANHNDLCRSLVERIYAIKSTLAEEQDKQHFVWQPCLDEPLLQQEIPLMKWLAAQTIEVWSVQDPI